MRQFAKYMVIIVGGVAVLAHIALAFFAFAQADDFGYARGTEKFGVLGDALLYYQFWEGRFSFDLALGAACKSVFPYEVNWFLLGSMASFAFAIAFTLKRLDGRFSALLLADTAFVLLALPGPVKRETFYWLTGHVAYLLPLTLLSFALALVERRYKMPQRIVLAALFLIFVALGMFTFVLSLLMVLCTGFLLISQYPRISKRWLAVFAGALAGFVIEAVAPGNLVRLHTIHGGHPEGLATIIGYSLIDIVYTDLPQFLIACLLYGMARAYATHRPAALCRTPRAAAACAASTLVAVAASYLMVVYGYNGGFPTGRTLLAPFLLLFIMTFDATKWLALAYPLDAMHRHKKIALGALALVLTVWTAYLPLTGIHILRRGFEQGEEQQQMALSRIRAGYQAQEAGATSLTLPAIPNDRSPLFFAGLTHHFGEYFGLKVTEMK